MKSFWTALIALFVASAAWAQTDPAACSCTAPVLRAGLLNANAGSEQPFAAERVAAMSSQLPLGAAVQGLDVMCLTELRTPALRDVALQRFRADPQWHVYQPEAQSRAGCSSACNDRVTLTEYGLTLPVNKWAQFCTLNPIPGETYSCAQLPDEAAFQGCMAQFCPFLPPFIKRDNPTCKTCLETPVDGEDNESRVLRCTASFDDERARQCWAGDSNQAGATLVSRLPLQNTEYRAIALPPPRALSGAGGVLDYPGVANWGITYGKVQTASGPVHLFCSSMSTGANGMDSVISQQVNATQSQEVLNYIRSKANGQPAVFMGDTGSGPAVAASITGPAAARWPQNFSVLQAGLTDALLANLGDNLLPKPAAACTFGCGGAPGSGRFVDHIMSSGRAVVAGGAGPALCHRRGGPMFALPTVKTSSGYKTLSDHYGVFTDLCLAQSRCDANNDGTIGPEDLDLIKRAIGQPVTPALAAYDANGDNKITQADVLLCTSRCTQRGCGYFPFAPPR